MADVAVANESAKTTGGIVVHENRNDQIDEIFRGLRTNIQFMMTEGQKTILFTSSTSGEGKTFNAANECGDEFCPLRQEGDHLRFGYP